MYRQWHDNDTDQWFEEDEDGIRELYTPTFPLFKAMEENKKVTDGKLSNFAKAYESLDSIPIEKLNVDKEI